MNKILKIHINDTIQSNDLLNMLIDVIDANAENMDYYTIIGIIDVLKDAIKTEMEE